MLVRRNTTPILINTLISTLLTEIQFTPVLEKENLSFSQKSKKFNSILLFDKLFGVM